MEMKYGFEVNTSGTMKKLNEIDTASLRWIQPSFWQESYELLTDDVKVATLAIPSQWTRKGEVEIDGKKWLLQVSGFFSRNIDIIDAASNAKVGIIRKFMFADSELEIFGFGKYKIHNFSIFGQKWGITDAGGRKIVLFSAYSTGFRDFFKHQDAVEVMPDAKKLDYIVLMIAAVWYSHIQDSKRAATMAAAT